MSLLRRIFTIFLTIFVCYTHGQLDCKITKLGKEYVGLKNVTISGITCQAWSSQYPHKHTLSDNKVLRKSRNYCRNPDGEPEGPWCYTTNNNIRWAYCGIPSCPLTDDECYEEGKGIAYLGKKNVTESGYACRRWDSEDSNVYQVFEHLENYCRSPDGAPFPWCLSTAPGKRWEKCQIPICGSKTTTTIPTTTSIKLKQAFSNGQLECKVTVHGINYFGLKNLTVSGRTCQDWSSQYPHKHRQTDKIKLRNSRNYCRNPDGEPGGPWCYTTDRNKRWEYCEIPSCPVTEDKCYKEGKGYTYLGKINVTETGYACRRWDSEGVYVYQAFEHLENYCRSPDGAPFPWCLSTALDKRWEKCQIPICGRNETTIKKTTTTAAATTTTTFQQATILNPEGRNSNSTYKERIFTANNNGESCKENSVVVEVVTVVTLGFVLVVVVGSIYVIIMLRQNRLQCLLSQRTTYAVNNVYDPRVSDIQTILF